jgi:membrane protease YdiL (CAAX protease family)
MNSQLNKWIEVAYVFSVAAICFYWAFSLPENSLPLVVSIVLFLTSVLGCWYIERVSLIGRNLKGQAFLLILFFAFFVFFNIWIQEIYGLFDNFIVDISKTFDFSISSFFSVITCFMTTAIWEEIVFRKFLLRFWVDVPTFARVALCSLVCAVLHGSYGFLNGFFLSVFLCMIYQ